MRRKIFTIIEVSSKSGVASRVYDIVMQIAIVSSIIPLMFKHSSQTFYFMEFVPNVLFITDYLLRWTTADYRSKYKGIKAFLIYPFTPTAIFDLITILPAITPLNCSFKAIRTWRLLKILRVVRIFKYFEPLQIIMEVFRKKASILFTIIGFAVFYIFVTALFMFNIEGSVNPDVGDTFFHDFIDALYWSACTLTTVGYGDIYPVSTAGRFVSMLSALVGVAIIALPSGVITAGYMEEVNERKERKNKAKFAESNNATRK